MNAGRILIVDDDPQIRRVMKLTLTGAGFDANDVASGEEAIALLRRERHDLVLLDLNMLGMGGLEACRVIRRDSEIAVIILSVRDDELDKVSALDAGADDYVTKPFRASELIARIRAALRRAPGAQDFARGRLTLGAVEIDFDTRHIAVGSRRVHLTPREFDLLRYLVAHANRVLTHRELLQGVWGPDYGDDVDSLRVVVNQLRKKIEIDPSKPEFLLTEPWVGYRLSLTVSGTVE